MSEHLSSSCNADKSNVNALGREVGGEHYKSAYQPIQLMERVHMFACCSFILKYVYRHKNKGKKQDLEKALHCCDLLEQLGQNWYSGCVKDGYSTDTAVYEFHDFIKCNVQLDGNQIRAILAICDRDVRILKSAIKAEMDEYNDLRFSYIPCD